MNAMVDLSKLSKEELVALVMKTQSKGKISFDQSEKNDKFWTFKHGTTGAWPVSTTPEAWLAICANVDMIKDALTTSK